MAKGLRLSYNTVFSVVKLRKNLYIAASILNLWVSVELDEVYVIVGFKGEKGFRRRHRLVDLKCRGRGIYAVDKPMILRVGE